VRVARLALVAIAGDKPEVLRHEARPLPGCCIPEHLLPTHTPDRQTASRMFPRFAGGFIALVWVLQKGLQKSF
jgi:hypothetical protein